MPHPLPTSRRAVILPAMGHRLIFTLPVLCASWAPTLAAAPSVDKAEEAARIEKDCDLKKGTITVAGDQISLRPSPNEAYNHLDCALTRLKKAGLGTLGFIGNEADPNAVLRPPLRYIAEGSQTEIGSLARAAEAEKWTVTRRATSTDGQAILQFESGPKMTNGEASKLLDHIWKKEFGDLEFGAAPRRLSEPPGDDD